MNCPKCGKENPDDVQMCSYCGSELTEDVAALMQEAKVSSLAVASFIFALLPIISCILVLPYDGPIGPVPILTSLISPPVGLILGIISIFKIRKSKGKLKGSGLATVAIVISGLLEVLLLPAILKLRCLSPRMLCGTNMSNLGRAIMVYCNDYDDKYPTPDKWCDLLLQGGYVSEKQFRCLGNKKARCSYAINPNAKPNSPPDMVLLFETKGGWNQFGGPELVTADNHDGEGCNVLFNDFHVKFVKTDRLGELKWTVEESETPPKTDANGIE